MKRLLFVFFLLPFCMNAQTINSAGGNLTAASASCLSTNCLSVRLYVGSASVSVTLSGTFSATTSFEQSGDFGVTWVAASPASSATTGTTQFNVAALTNFRVRVSTYVSGTVAATIISSSASSGSSSGGGSVSATTGMISCLDVSPACVSDNTVLDASTTNTSNIVTCPNSDCHFLTTAAVGQVVQGGTPTQGVVLNTTTILSVDSDTQIHTVANATATGTGTVYLAWGPDNTASMDALSNATVKVCKYAFIPAGFYLTQHAGFNFTTGNCANANAGRVGGLIGAGLAWLNAKILMRYDFLYDSSGPSGGGCNAGLNSATCFFGVPALDVRAIAIDMMYYNTNFTNFHYIAENNAGYWDRVGISGPQNALASGKTNIALCHFSGIEGITREGACVGGYYACINEGTLSQFIINPCINSANIGLLGSSGTYFSKGNYYGSGTVGIALQCNSGATCHHENDTFNPGTSINSGITYLDKIYTTASGLGITNNNGAFLAIRNTNSANTITLTNNAGGTVVDECGVAWSNFSITNNGIWSGDCSTQGQLQTAGNITPSTGWGTTGAAGNGVSAVTGQSVNENFTITATGTPTANPTIAIVFPVAFAVAPTICIATQTGGTGAISPLTVSANQTKTGVTFKWNGTPGAASTYIISVECTNR